MHPKPKPITVYCSEELHSWIARYAAQDNRSMSGWICRKLEQARQRSVLSTLEAQAESHAEARQ
jgi:hypothetical protein